MINNKKIHIVGIKGMGTSSLAVIYSMKGYRVTGSDETEYSIADELLSRHPEIKVFETFSPKHIEGADLVVRSVAYDEKNVEVSEAIKRKTRVLTYPQAAGDVLEGYSAIAISGCNGKTTTSGMVSMMLMDCGLDPSYIIGAPMQGGRDNAHLGKSSLFVIEADEYRDAFYNYAPSIDIAIITNVAHDHPDYFLTFDDAVASYREFVNKVKPGSKLIVCGDDAGSQALLSKITSTDKKIETYGFNLGNNWLIDSINQDEERSVFRLQHNGVEIGTFDIKVFGQHNILNASAAIAVGSMLAVEPEKMRESIANYSGSRRRFELLFDNGKIAIIDDHAHHPIAIKATFSAARQRYPGREIIAIFQLHTYSRSSILLEEFAEALSQADKVYLLDIYGSVREKKEENPVTIIDLINATKKHSNNVFFIEDNEQFVDAFPKEVGDRSEVILTLGVGDVGWTIGANLSKKFKRE